MAVGTQQPQVLQPVITPVPVDVIHLQSHGFAEPLGADPAVGALFGHAHVTERPTQHNRAGPTLAAMLDQDILRASEGWAALTALMSLAQKVLRGELVLGDPQAQTRTLSAAVRAPQAAQHLGEGEGLDDCGT